jgi:signal transduction histidine kinase
MTKTGRPHGQDWALLGVRLAVSTAAVIAAWLIAGSLPSPDSPYLIPGIAIIAGAALVLVVCWFIPALYDSLTWVLLLTGWATAGGAALLMPFDQTDALMVALPMLSAVAVLDILTARWPWSGLAPIGGAAGAALALALAAPYLPLMVFVPSGVVAGVICAGVWVWAGMQSQWGDDLPTRLRRQLEATQEDLAAAREMMRAVVDVSIELSSQSTTQVLSRALDIGLLALRKSSENGGGMVSMIFLNGQRDELVLFEHRGLTHLDVERPLEGKAGVVGRSLSEASPHIGGPAVQDPELSAFVSLARTRSTLAVPLRMEYTNYGVMVFASADENAFTDERLDLMTALGTLVTVSLQNATLYNSLRREKERLMQVETNARQALVRDMHDIPTQTISAVTMRAGVAKLMIERNQPIESIVSELTAIETMAQQATAEIRHVLFKLRPLALESQGVSAALDQLAEKTRKTYQQNVVLKCDEAVDDVLSQDAQDALFFIIEEAVSNARKYAKAQTIRIDVAVRGTEVWARVADNGAGFDVEATRDKYAQRGSFGMINLEERAELVGGRLSLQSQQGKGTVVTVVLPVMQDADSTHSRRINDMKLGMRGKNEVVENPVKPPMRRAGPRH